MRMLVVALVACGSHDGTYDVASRDAAPTIADAAAAKPTDLVIEPGIEMRHPIRSGNLTIIPLVQTTKMNHQHLITLVEGMANHSVVVRETSQVIDTSYVHVENKSELPLFIAAGELLYDGKQDRVVSHELVIEAGTSAKIEVTCVEQDRENGHMPLHASGIMAELRIRQHVAFNGQEMVWAHITELAREHHFTPVTGSYRRIAGLQNETEPAARRDALAKQLAELPDRIHLVGLVAVTGTKIFAYDRYISAELYGQMEHELLGSYIASDDAEPTESSVTPADVRVFAQQQKRSTLVSWSIIPHP